MFSSKLLSIIVLLFIIGGLLVMVNNLICSESMPQKDESIWSNRFNNLALSISVEAKLFLKSLNDIKIKVRIKNFGSDEESIGEVRGNIFANYRVAVFDMTGHPVAKSKAIMEAEKAKHDIKIQSRRSIRLAEDEELTETLKLSRFVDIKKPGKYCLVAMRHIFSWDFLISNAVFFEIREDEKQKQK